ncbi:MAG TPA: HemK/PrmC family methyltransferase [Candidatus Binatus sp.]|nr:HemK/PrmC family methyltransferase [Candidatus Binatus sp.]
MATVAELLRDGTSRLRDAGSETARLDAELLLGHVAGLERTALLAHPDAPVPDGTIERYEAAVARREAGEPVAYIRGLKEFRGLALAVDPRALIPRPETERLGELAEAELAARLTATPRPAGTPPIEVVDVGTGSGAVVVALAVALRRRGMLDDVRLLATDVSREAIGLARENAVGHAVGDRIDLAIADLVPAGTGPWDLVLANLPYVRSDAIAGLPRAAGFEPRQALDGGRDGLAVIGRLLDLLPAALARGGQALLEIGGDQGDAIVGEVARRLPGWTCAVELDLSRLPRVARVERDPGPTGPA